MPRGGSDHTSDYLQGLSDDESARLLRTILDGAQAPAEQDERIRELFEGEHLTNADIAHIRAMAGSADQVRRDEVIRSAAEQDRRELRQRLHQAVALSDEQHFTPLTDDQREARLAREQEAVAGPEWDGQRFLNPNEVMERVRGLPPGLHDPTPQERHQAALELER